MVKRISQLHCLGFTALGITRLSILLQQVLMEEVMDYLTLCYLHPTPFFVPSPPLLPAAAVLWGNEWASCCICISLCQTPPCIWCERLVCMCMFSLYVHPQDWLWDLCCVCVFVCVSVFVGVCLARSFCTLHAGLEQADKLFAKTGN